MDDKLDSRRVRYFMQVIESGSVRGAAEALDMDPSAVSRALSLLESDCGARLFERRGRGIEPTDAGLLLAGYLRREWKQKKQLLAQLDSLQKAERGHIDLVAGEGFIDWLMAGSLRGFMGAHPGVTVDLDVASTDEIVRRVVEERAHIGMVFQPPKDERLRSHHASETPIVALMHDTHPLARMDRPLALEDLVPYPGAALHRSFGVRQHIEAAEVSENVRLRIALTTSSFGAIGNFVLAGLGYALTTWTSLPSRIDRSRLVALPMANPLLSQGKVHVVSRHGRVLPPAAALMLEQIVADFRTGTPPGAGPAGH
ncbi:MAG: LysR family transcriptional regulator [Curvibacter sp.]|nr:LysR family transcriptional regulator [Curvibacter sp.]